MRKSRFTDEQMAAILREVDKTSVVEAFKRNKANERSINAWRKHFGGLAPADIKRLNALESENGKLKKLLAERDLEIDIMCEVNRKKRRACGLLGGATLDAVLCASPAQERRCAD